MRMCIRLGIVMILMLSGVARVVSRRSIGINDAKLP